MRVVVGCWCMYVLLSNDEVLASHFLSIIKARTDDGVQRNDKHTHIKMGVLCAHHFFGSFDKQDGDDDDGDPKIMCGTGIFQCWEIFVHFLHRVFLGLQRLDQTSKSWKCLILKIQTTAPPPRTIKNPTRISSNDN